MAKHSIQIDDDKLFEEIVAYCKLNNLQIKMFCTDMLRKQFLLEKYGDIPFGTLYENTDNKNITTAFIKHPDDGTDYEKTLMIEVQKDSDGENKTIEIIDMRKSTKQPSAEVVLVPYEVEMGATSTNTATVSPKYTQKEVPNKFYGELTMEAVEKADEEIHKQTSKPKKRRL